MSLENNILSIKSLPIFNNPLQEINVSLETILEKVSDNNNFNIDAVIAPTQETIFEIPLDDVFAVKNKSFDDNFVNNNLSKLLNKMIHSQREQKKLQNVFNVSE
jgi:hypothetical protein